VKRFTLPVLPVRIGARLYCLAGLALATVVILATAALHFVTIAAGTARDIRDRIEVDLLHMNELELLLERHRRIVESAPVELDRDRLSDLRERSRALIVDMGEHAPTHANEFSRALEQLLPEVSRQGDATLHLAYNYAQAAAIDQVQLYVEVARKLQNAIQYSKAEQLSAVDREVAGLIHSGQVVTRWVMLGSAVALILIGPFSLMITRQIVRRLARMTQTMLQLAQNDTAVYVSGTGYPDELGDMARALGVFKANAIALLAKQTEIETLNQRFEFAIQNMSRGLSMFDKSQRLIVCNNRYRDLYGLTEELAQPGAAFNDIIAHRIKAGTGRAGETPDQPRLPWPCDDPAWATQTEQIMLTHDLADGRIIQIAYQPLHGGGWVALHADVTEERRQEARIEKLAHFDSVTGIPNRHFFKQRLDELTQALPVGGAFAVHWIDLDRFKAVNDTFGHPVGDALLQQVAARLTRAVRSEDFVARLGGDEFAVIQMKASQANEIQPLAERLIKVLSEPYMLGTQRLEIGASVGVVIAPDHGMTAKDLIRKADIGLYQAKAKGRGRFVLFEDALVQEITARRSLEVDLLEAMANGDFELYYQPILDLARAEVVVCEALMRWTHAKRGPVSPAVFIPLAEEIGAISELGAFALKRACADAMGWPAHIKVAVNLSAMQFVDGGVLETVMDALHVTGLPPARLELEITETALMRDDAATIETLEQLRSLGISIALDDFGTGYSSLNYLRRLPFDKIKIDQSFIRDMPSHTECVAIVRAVTDLAKSLGITTVAEGVETVDHLARVRAAGCNAVQGYLISRPVRLQSLAFAIENAPASTISIAA
jgi:diguanylate cyclase (GGDEF)-like protein